VLSHYGYLDTVTYGLPEKTGAGSWRWNYRFVGNELQTDDRAGGVYRHADITGASFGSYLTHSTSWRLLTDARPGRKSRKALPVARTPALSPGYVGGYHCADRGLFPRAEPASPGQHTGRYEHLRRRSVRGGPRRTQSNGSAPLPPACRTGRRPSSACSKKPKLILEPRLLEEWSKPRARPQAGSGGPYDPPSAPC